MLAAQLPVETPVHCLAQLVVEALPLPLALVEVDATAAAREEEPIDDGFEPTDTRPIAAANIEETDTEEELSEDERLRRAIESRIMDKIDKIVAEIVTKREEEEKRKLKENRKKKKKKSI